MAEENCESLHRVCRRGSDVAGPFEGGAGFGSQHAPVLEQRRRHVQLQLRPPVARCSCARRPLRGRASSLIRYLDCSTEMGDRLPEGRAAKGLIARLTPPFDRKVVEASLGEMMRDDFRLRCGALRPSDQDFGGAAMQRLAAALEQAVVGRILDQRVLEAIARLMACALSDQEIGTGEPVERGLEREVVDTADRAEQRIGEISPEHGATLIFRQAGIA